MENQDNEPHDILLIDDEPDVLLMVGELLRQKGYKVLGARDAGHALRQLDETKFRLVLLDLNLAGENGLELMGLLRRNHPDVLMVLHTGLDHDSQEVKEILNRGAATYLNKADGPEALLYVVEELLGKPLA